MKLVTTIDDIFDNLVRFDSYRSSKNSQHREFFVGRLRLGKIFVHGIVNGKHLFCPSRFVGYVKCTAEKHIAFPYKNGSITTPRINRLLGEHRTDKSAEKNTWNCAGWRASSLQRRAGLTGLLEPEQPHLT